MRKWCGSRRLAWIRASSRTYIINSTSTFNLDSDKIIYLTNLGAPNSVITAMMQRDQQLQQQFAAAAGRATSATSAATGNRARDTGS